MDTPFHQDMNNCHHITSALADTLSRMWWFGADHTFCRAYNLCRKALPGPEALVVTTSLPWTSFIISCRQSSLTAGRHSWRLRESTSIPRKVRQVVGPSSLLGSRGRPSLSKMEHRQFLISLLLLGCSPLMQSHPSNVTPALHLSLPTPIELHPPQLRISWGWSEDQRGGTYLCMSPPPIAPPVHGNRLGE